MKEIAMTYLKAHTQQMLLWREAVGREAQGSGLPHAKLVLYIAYIYTFFKSMFCQTQKFCIHTAPAYVQFLTQDYL